MTTPQTPVDALMALVEKYGEACRKELNVQTARDAFAIWTAIEASARALAAIPAGFVLVPVEPTDEMELAAENDYEQRGETFPDWKAKWRAMLAAAPSPSAVQPLSEAHGDVRVACITLDGSTLYIPAKEITDFGIGDDDGETYTLTFKTMTRAEFEALGEFDGF